MNRIRKTINIRAVRVIRQLGLLRYHHWNSVAANIQNFSRVRITLGGMHKKAVKVYLIVGIRLRLSRKSLSRY
jgi:hypothetical protein